MTFEHPWLLWLLPLALLPLRWPAAAALPASWLSWAPPDRASTRLDLALRVLAALALATVVLALAGPYRAEYPVQRVGRGSEIVLLLDRSRSMDQGFAGSATPPPAGTGPEALAYYARLQQARGRESKAAVAQRLLAEFAARRTQDRFGMMVFSTAPIRVLDFTHKPDAIQAAIAAVGIGRGLSDTDIGLALESALSMFADRPYTGSRLILLVSDGGDHIDAAMRERIAAGLHRHRVALYWIYIRTAASPGLTGGERAAAAAEGDTVPEYFLHRYFQSTGTPYRAYEAENPDDLQRAIDDVNRLENLPITYVDTVPRRDLAVYGYAVALACVVLLLGADALEIRRWA